MLREACIMHGTYAYEGGTGGYFFVDVFVCVLRIMHCPVPRVSVVDLLKYMVSV